VLRPDGTLWLNMGDCYHSGDRGGYQNTQTRYDSLQSSNLASDFIGAPNRMPQAGLKDKDLVGMPWRVAFALQADGWWLRSDIIWSKPNPMPESVTDRPTKAHEYVFLLARSGRYFYDADAVREESAGEWNSASMGNRPKIVQSGTDPERMRTWGHGTFHRDEARSGRNKRTVWEIPTQPYPEAHFATFPEALVLPCIQAGTSERGCCPKCGAPWERVMETEYWNDTTRSGRPAGGNNVKGGEDQGARTFASGARTRRIDSTVGWRPTCSCGVAETVPATVLDPFAGSGTTLLVAAKNGRHSIGIELQADYVPLIRRRLAGLETDLVHPVRVVEVRQNVEEG